MRTHATPVSGRSSTGVENPEGQGLAEAALIQALTPAADETEGGPARTRSIRVIRDNESRSVSTRPIITSKPACASLVITFEGNLEELMAKAKQSLDVVVQPFGGHRPERRRAGQHLCSGSP